MVRIVCSIIFWCSSSYCGGFKEGSVLCCAGVGRGREGKSNECKTYVCVVWWVLLLSVVGLLCSAVSCCEFITTCGLFTVKRGEFETK